MDQHSLGIFLDEYGAEEEQKQFWPLDILWDQPEGGTSQFATTPNHAELNPGSMNVQFLQWAQQPGTSQPSNITNAADAERRARIRESKRNSWVKKETGRKENEKRLVELAKENGVLLEANASLEKKVVEAKVKQKSVEQERSKLKRRLTRFKKNRKSRDSKITRSIEKIRADMVEIIEGQERIRARHEEVRKKFEEIDKEARKKFEEIDKEAAKLKEETDTISKQSAANQVRLDLMFQIVKARSENDVPKDAALSQIPRALINGEAEECKHNMS